MNLPIRIGCYVEFRQRYRNGSEALIRGTIVDDKRLPEGHQFTVQHINDPQWLLNVSGRRLYSNLVYHEQGEKSKIDERRARKRGKKKWKKRRERHLSRAKRRWT